MALWDVNDRIRRPEDKNIPYGFSKQSTIKHSDEESFIHSTNKANYPSAHITNKVFDKKISNRLWIKNKLCYRGSF